MSQKFAQADLLIKTTLDHFGRVDIVILQRQGFGRERRQKQIDEELWDKTIRINLKARGRSAVQRFRI